MNTRSSKKIEYRLCLTCGDRFEVEPHRHAQWYCTPEHRPALHNPRAYDRSLMQRGRGAVLQPDEYADYYRTMVEEPQRSRDDGELIVPDWMRAIPDTDEEAMMDELRRTGMVQSHGPDTGTDQETKLMAKLYRNALKEAHYAKVRRRHREEAKSQEPDPDRQERLDDALLA